MLFQAKDTIISKAINLIHARLQAGSTTPSQASKIRGVCGFVAAAQWGRVGRAPMGPLRRRQYSDKPPWHNSFELCRAFELLLMLMQVVVPRSVQVVQVTAPTGSAVIYATMISAASMVSICVR